jgi:hypothetical protein
MKAATIKELKQELNTHSSKELVEICLRLSKFKKENKELLTYILYESADEFHYIKSVKNEINLLFEQINYKSIYYIKKSVRKILNIIKKYIRYSKKKETEVELLMYFCNGLHDFIPKYHQNIALNNLYNRQIDSIKRTIKTLHEDLQYDYNAELENLHKQ